MPWEKSFKEEEAIERAMKLFWEKGYEPASIADIIEATGVNRGSLYNAFGGKQKLFVKALMQYVRENHRKALSELEALDSPNQAIKELFDTIVKETAEDSEKKGCFLINTSLELASHDEEVNAIVKKSMGEIEAFFRRSIEVAQARGQIPSSVEASETAKSLLALIVAIRVLGRGVFEKSALDVIADQREKLLS